MGDHDLECADIHLCKSSVDKEKNLEIALCVVNSDHVEVTLPELSVATLLRLLSAPDLADVVALEREGECAVVCSDVAGKRDCQVESEGDITSAVVCEAEHLLVGLSATLAEKNLCILKCRGVDWYESEGSENALDLGHELLSYYLLLRQAVSESFKDFWFYHIHLCCVVFFPQICSNACCIKKTNIVQRL